MRELQGVSVSERWAGEAGVRLGLAPNCLGEECSCLSCVQSKYHLPATEKSPVPTKIPTALHWNILMYSLFNPFVTEYFMTLHCHVGRICKAPFSMSVQDNLIANIILYQKAFALCLLGSGSTEPPAQGRPCGCHTVTTDTQTLQQAMAEPLNRSTLGKVATVSSPKLVSNSEYRSFYILLVL